jgi:hypothetical protein
MAYIRTFRIYDLRAKQQFLPGSGKILFIYRFLSDALLLGLHLSFDFFVCSETLMVVGSIYEMVIGTIFSWFQDCRVYYVLVSTDLSEALLVIAQDGILTALTFGYLPTPINVAEKVIERPRRT